MALNIFSLSGEYTDGSLEELVTQHVVRNHDKTFSCLICGKMSRLLHHAKAHLESSHFPSESGYECQVCGISLKTKNALAVHMSKKHK